MIDWDADPEAGIHALLLERRSMALNPLMTLYKKKAAASVVAKVTRDALMAELTESYPAFDLDRNAGYPSPVHQTALRGYGLTPLHRRSWKFTETIPWERTIERNLSEPQR